MKSGINVGRMAHHCGSRQGLNLYEQENGNIDGFCFSCKTYEPDPLNGNTMEKAGIPRTAKTKDEIEEELNEIDFYPITGLDDRKIGKGTMEYFKCRVALDQERQEKVEMHFYPYKGLKEGRGYKVRLVEGKRIWSVGSMRDVYPFGWDQAIASGSKRLYITEGEIDAMSLFSVIMQKQAGTQYAQDKPAVVSIPHGAAGAAKDLAKIQGELRKYFKEIILVFDMDEAGRKAVEETLKIFPDAKVANLPQKDVNECVLEGNIKALFNAVVFNAEKPKNTRLVYAEDLFELAKTPAKFGLSWPWRKTTELTRGIRFGETIYIGGPQKFGKSEIVNTIAAHLIKEHGLKVMMAKPEEANAKTVKLLAGKMVGRIFHDPKVEFDVKAFDEACEMMRGKVTMLNLYQQMDWGILKQDIRAAVAEGAKAVFIDPITTISNGFSAAEANTVLQEMAQEASAMALDLDIVIFLFCHVRNPDGGLAHERGGKVLTSQFAGSRAMARSCNYLFALEGNKDPELSEEDRNCRQLVLLEDREFGEVGSTNLFWNKLNGEFIEL